MRKKISIIGVVLVSVLIVGIILVFILNSLVYAQADIQAMGKYTVKRGDTLADISSFLSVDDVRKIKTGQEIRFPLPQKILQDGEEWGEEKIYNVVDGDFPEEIARKLGIPGWKIVEWNPEMGCHLVYPGQGIIYREIKKVKNIGPKIKEIKEATAEQAEREKIQEIQEKLETQTNLLDFTEMRLREMSKEVELNNKIIELNAKRQLKRQLIILIAVCVNIVSGLIALFLILWFVRDYKKEREKEKEEKIKQKQSQKIGVAEELEPEEEAISFKIKGEDYLYMAKKKNGKYVSLYINPKTKEPFLFEKRQDLIRSLKRTFHDIDIFKREIREGNLAKIE